MFPSFKTGDYVICTEKHPKDIKVGDVIVVNINFFLQNKRDRFFFERFEGLPLIHRVIYNEEKEGKYFFLTKGDNNIRIDGGSRILKRKRKYVILEYSFSNLILIPESYVIGVVLNKPLAKCKKCGNKIIDFSSIYKNLYVWNEIPLQEYKKMRLKLYINNKKESNGKNYENIQDSYN